MLDALADIVGVFGVQQRLDVLHGAGEDIERFGLVESDLLKIVSGILLKNESAIPSQNTGLAKRPQYLLHQIKISSPSSRPSPLSLSPLGRLRLLLPRHQVNYLVVLYLNAKEMGEVSAIYNQFLKIYQPSGLPELTKIILGHLP